MSCRIGLPPAGPPPSAALPTRGDTVNLRLQEGRRVRLKLLHVERTATVADDRQRMRYGYSQIAYVSVDRRELDKVRSGYALLSEAIAITVIADTAAVGRG